MAKKQIPKIDMAQLQEKLQRQFANLDSIEPFLWPTLPRYLLYIFIALTVSVVLWFVKLSDYQEEWETAKASEITLKQDYQKKLLKSISLEALKKQREQIQQYVIQLEKQLPSKAEMASLLSDINQAGLGRSLQFDLFRPGQIVVRDYYAELPIAVRVTGKYHDIGAFAADVANLSRIVTLNNISIAPATKDSNSLTMDAAARTFRYLDPEEVLAQRKVTTKAGGTK